MQVPPAVELLGQYTAGTMPPPPRGGYRASMVDWRPGRLTQAKLKAQSIVALPDDKVAALQRHFNNATLSSGGANEAAKAGAKGRLEADLSRRLRKVRAHYERKELGKALQLCDYRLKEGAGRIIELSMRRLLTALAAISRIPLSTHSSASSSAAPDAAGSGSGSGSGTHGLAVGVRQPRPKPTPPDMTKLYSKRHRAHIEAGGTPLTIDHRPRPTTAPAVPRLKWDVASGGGGGGGAGGEEGHLVTVGSPRPPTDESWHCHREATMHLPSRLLPVRSEVMLSSHDERVPRLETTTALLETLLLRSIRLSVAAMQPAAKLAHLKPMQRLLERTLGNYEPRPPPPPTPIEPIGVEEIHQLRGRWRPHVAWPQLVTAIGSAVHRSFAAACTHAAHSMATRASLLTALLTAEQLDACARRKAERKAKAATEAVFCQLSVVRLKAPPPPRGLSNGEAKGGRGKGDSSPKGKGKGKVAAEAAAAAKAADAAPSVWVRLALRPAPSEEGGGMDFELAQMARIAAAAAAAHAVEAEAEGDATRDIVTEFDGLSGWATDWGQLLRRIEKEMRLAANWGRYVAATQAHDWGRAGMLHLGCTSLVAHGVMQVGVTLHDGQLSASHHANSLLHAARLVSHQVTHSAQMALRLADSSPIDLKEFVEKLQQLGRADKDVERAVLLPERLEALYRMLEDFGVSVPGIDRQYVAGLRSWGSGLATKHEAFHEQVRGPTPKYASEAVEAAEKLRTTIHFILKEAATRGLFSQESVAERMMLLAKRICTRLAHIGTTEVPTLLDWLQTLRMDASILGLNEVALEEMHIVSGAWELLSAWRRLFTSYLEMPLARLSVRPAACPHAHRLPLSSCARPAPLRMRLTHAAIPPTHHPLSSCAPSSTPPLTHAAPSSLIYRCAPTASRPSSAGTRREATSCSAAHTSTSRASSPMTWRTQSQRSSKTSRAPDRRAARSARSRSLPRPPRPPISPSRTHRGRPRQGGCLAAPRLRR